MAPRHVQRKSQVVIPFSCCNLNDLCDLALRKKGFALRQQFMYIYFTTGTYLPGFQVVYHYFTIPAIQTEFLTPQISIEQSVSR